MLWPDTIIATTFKLLRPATAALLLTVAAPIPGHSTENSPDGARCAVTGTLTVSAYLVFLAEFANGRTDSATTEGGRVSDMIALHNGLGCDAARLTIAIECLTARILDHTSSAPNLIAEACMEKAGMPTP